MSRKVRIAAIQTAPASPDKDATLANSLELIERAAADQPDFIVFPELFNTQFWCVGLKDSSYFEWAEPIPGPTTELLSEKAQQHRCHIIAPIFEKGELEGEYYNSAALIGPDGKTIPGMLPDGRQIPAYRKNYISNFRWGDMQNDEAFYFRPGPGYPIFETKHGKIGILICFDRWFPESYRVLAVQGAKIIFVVNGSAGFVSDLFTCTTRSHAAENMVFIVSVNRAGVETVQGINTRYYGLSLVVGPDGTVLDQAPEGEGPVILSITADLEQVDNMRRRVWVYRDRRPELYEPLTRR